MKLTTPMNTFRIKFSAVIAFLVVLTSCSEGQKEPVIIKAEGPPPILIPLPDSLSWGENMFMVPEDNTICYSEGGGTAAAFLQELLKGASVEAEITKGINCGNWNLVLNDSLTDLGEEGYRLDIGQDKVTIEGATAKGLFYGVQTLRQMFPAAIEQRRVEQDTLLLHQVQLQDVPRFEWRGTMVDVARSFFGLQYLKEHVDRMALYKLNRLHLHLTDDQGWRIEIKSWPKLTETGGNSSVKEGHSGFLTQEEYKELQTYASARNVMIVPEIDMPGHIYSALRSYPELNCEGLSNIDQKRGATYPEPYEEYRVGWSKLCLEKPEIYDFVAEVLGEMSAITTGPYLHIGGDEIEDPKYEEFIVKADSIVRGLGKTSIGWEEGTKAEVDSSFISQKWHGRVESVVPNVRVIHSLCSQYYFDHGNVPGQEFTNNWCKESGVSMEDAYAFASEDPNIIGVEAPVWTEFVINEEMLDDRFWPRTLAMAEVGWTAGEKRNYEDFFSRLGGHAARLNHMGINYFETPGIDWKKEENKAEEATNVFSGFMPKE